MKDFVSDRRIRAAGSISAVLLLWAAFVSPGNPLTGYVSMGTLSVLLVTTTVMCLGRLAPVAAMARVIHDVEAETAPRLSSAGKERIR